MLIATRKEVSEYRSVIKQVHALIEDNPEVNRSFICEAVLEKFNRDTMWFLTMQEFHKQAINDSIKDKD